MSCVEEPVPTLMHEMAVRLAWTDFICIHGDMMGVSDAHRAGLIRCEDDGKGVVVRIFGNSEYGPTLPL